MLAHGQGTFCRVVHFGSSPRIVQLSESVWVECPKKRPNHVISYGTISLFPAARTRPFFLLPRARTAVKLILRPTIRLSFQKTKQYFWTPWQAFSPGDVKKCSLLSQMSYWSFFERSLVGLADFEGSQVPTDGQLAQCLFFYRNRMKCMKHAAWFVQFSQFRFFFIETGPVGHPLKFELAKSAKIPLIPLENWPTAHCDSREHF